jgi:type VI secretion system protein ImpK
LALSPNAIDKTAGPGTPLRQLFTDLIAFTVLFRESCPERPWTPVDLRDRLTALIEAQERRARGGEVPWDAYVEARFAVLAWVDEVILNSPWPGRADWQHLMLTYYGTLNAGKQLFERLEHLPSGERDVREIYYFCLALGFEGKFALAENPNALQELKRTLYHQLVSTSGGVLPSDARLFPEAYRRPPPPAPPPGQSLVGLWLGLIAAVPVILFIIYLSLLRSAADARIRLLGQPIPSPTVAVPAPAWNLSLVEELRRRGVDARDTPRGVVITLPGVSFEVNRSDLNPAGERSVRDVAAALLRLAPERLVAVEGHASREKGTLDEQNQRLSDERARRVADALVEAGLRRDRLTARGLGSSTPVASNETEEGRRLNRRVEMIVEKTEGR